jgi:methylmalonyl-CoA mutase N-terminal domain/subunit
VLRETRDNTSVTTRLDALQEVARRSDNMMPAIIDCVRARATEGEIVEALREVFGTHRETPVF